MKKKLISLFVVVFSLVAYLGTTTSFYQEAKLDRSGFFDPNHPTRVIYNERKKDRLVNIGRAPFAIAHKKFNCQSFLSSVEDLNFLHIAWLFNTFGTKYDCLKTLLHDPRLITLESNLINEPGHRNRRLEKHEFLYTVSSPRQFDRLLKAKNAKLKARFMKYVEPLQNLLASHLQPQTECLINPGLESNVSDRAGAVLVSWTREAFPYCRVVWNPLIAAPNRRINAKADLLEGHGATPNVKAPCLTNLDGTDINFPSRQSPAAKYYVEGQSKNWINSGTPLLQHLEEYANKCEVAFLWVVEDNCNNPATLSFTPPTKRSCNSGNINNLVAKEIQRALKNGRVAPDPLEFTEEELVSFNGCSEIRKPSDGARVGFVLKQSEFDGRGGALLLPYRASSAKIIHKGQTIDSYKYTGNYHGSSRALLRSNKSPTTYPYKVALVTISGSKKICYKIPNPRIRND